MTSQEQSLRKLTHVWWISQRKKKERSEFQDLECVHAQLGGGTFFAPRDVNNLQFAFVSLGWFNHHLVQTLQPGFWPIFKVSCGVIIESPRVDWFCVQMIPKKFDCTHFACEQLTTGIRKPRLETVEYYRPSTLYKLTAGHATVKWRKLEDFFAFPIVSALFFLGRSCQFF